MTQVNLRADVDDTIQPAITPNLPIGRPCKYETHVQPRLDDVFAWVKQGCTDYSIADSLGISHDSLIRYKTDFSELVDIYTRGRAERNTTVINSMFNKSNGHIVNVKQEKLDKLGGKVVLNSEIYTPPDVNAADLYLRNNMPGYVQARQEGSSNVNITVQLPAVQAEIDKLMTSRQALEAELAQIDLLPDAEGVWQTSTDQGKKPVIL